MGARAGDVEPVGGSFGETFGTPLCRLETDRAENARALRVVPHRGRLRAAEELTGRNDETIAAWIKRLGDHAEAATALLTREPHLSEVGLDELWSFVGRKGGARCRARLAPPANLRARANGGAA